MRTIAILSILFFMYTKAATQQIKRLTVGDKLPDLILGNVLNYKAKTLKTSELKGKLIILDFWNVNCKACIASMPKMQKLQEQYQDKIQILYVTKDNWNKVNALAKKIKIVRENKLPSVIADTILSSYFYFQTVPTHIWIDSSGIIKYITEGWDTNEKSISQYLRGERPNVDFKFEDETFKGNNHIALVEKTGKYYNNLQQYSFFMSKIEGAPTRLYVDTDSTTGNITTITFINELALNMFSYAFSERKFSFFDNRRVVLEGEVVKELSEPKETALRNDWRKSHFYSYQLKVPVNCSENIFHFMQQDLNRFFNVNARVIERKVSCLALIQTRKVDSLLSRGGNPMCTMIRGKFIVRNSLINGLVYWINNFTNGRSDLPIVVNNTDISANVDMEFDADLLENFSVERFNKELRRYGLMLKVIEQPVEVLLISKTTES